jgi:alpha-methylacyl-CoA racemase
MPALKNIRVIELAGLAPGPFTGLLLAENGADVLRVDRVAQGDVPSPDVLVHSKRSVCIDIKHPRGRDLLLRLVEHADVLIDPFRPGVLERLGLGPREALLPRNPRLVVARLTGYRRDGKYAPMAGHDLNYLAVSGVLSTLGGAYPLPPSPPGNLLADFAGGGLVCFAGILLALQARTTSCRGQVVEANMVDGVSYLATAPRVSSKIPGQWDRPRGENLIDGGCPYYRVYECADAGRYMAVAALEPKFFAALCRALRVSDKDWGGIPRDGRAAWPALHKLFADRFRTRTRAEWEAVFDGTDACCTPVLTYAEMEAARYEQRAMVALSDTPSEAPNDGWTPQTLTAGDGGEQLLHAWAGWERGRDYFVAGGGLHTVEDKAAKL